MWNIDHLAESCKQNGISPHDRLEQQDTDFSVYGKIRFYLQMQTLQLICQSTAVQGPSHTVSVIWVVRPYFTMLLGMGWGGTGSVQMSLVTDVSHGQESNSDGAVHEPLYHHSIHYL